MKRWSTSLFIRNIHNKIIIRFQYLLFECWYDTGQLYKFHTQLVEMKNGSSILKTLWQFSLKLNIRSYIIHQSPRYLSRRNEDTLYIHTKPYLLMFCQFNNWQKLKIKHIFISWWISKLYIYTMKYCLAIKNNKLHIFSATQMTLKSTRLHKRSQIHI